ncbi:putative T7SS-secreted protein [Amycolatopsis sp. NPDC051106]|uniref:putative T7SS-secreted protein n=1 Tax=unclassified Amycolatopsis TaxID=2618356 RepID=UPI0034140577
MTWEQLEDAVSPVGSADYPALGFDPAPGAVAGVEEIAGTLSAVAAELDRACDELTGVGKSGGFWEGDGADAFRETVGKVPGYLDQAHRSLAGAAGTLSGWADDLSALQRHAVDLETRAETAQAQLTTAQANPHLRLAGQVFTDPAELQRAEAALGRAQHELTEAQHGLDALRADAKRLRAQHRELAGQVAAALRKATDEAPEEPGWLDKIGDAVGKMVDGVKDLAGKAWKWTQQHADLIATIGDALSKVGSVLGVVAIATSWIPGVNAVTAAAAVGVSAAAVGTKLLAKAAGADVSWGGIGMDAIGIIPAGKTVATVGKIGELKNLAGLKSAAFQAGKGAVLAKAERFRPGITQMPVIGQKVVELGGESFAPITVKELVTGRNAAIEQAAKYSHAGAVNLLPGIKLDPFSPAGIATGVGVGSAKGVLVGGTKDFVTDKIGDHR